MNLDKIKKLNIPKSPGVYQFLDKKGDIIYIGKASNLNSRILSYFQKSVDHTPAKISMLSQIEKIKLIITDSEIEALLLEANLVKKYQPKYNILLRDDKRFVYIKISTEDEWPRVFMTRKIDKSGKYFGPFTSAESVKQVLKIIRKIWPYRSCARMPKRTCLYYRINKCLGMCEEKIKKQEYKKIINKIDLFLQGRKKDLRFKNIDLRILKNTNILSVHEKYENDVIELAKVLSLPKIPKRIEGYDISNIFGKQAVGSMVVFSNGESDKNEYRKFKIKNKELGDIAMLKEILERRFNNSWPMPDLIIVDGGKAQLNVAHKILQKLNLDIVAISISKGDGLRSSSARDKIFFVGEKNPLELPLASPALHLIKRVRDEAHRFAISYHRKLREKIF
ncbi:MAG: excinuclease ABC subunit UvrC [Candidatus Falkowbacteria bacterium]